MSRWSYAFRAAAFLTIGAYAVHQLRYLTSFGSHADEALTHHGHGYLSIVAPAITLVLAGVIGWILWALMQPAQTDGPKVAFSRAWGAASGCLVAVYTVEGLLEGQFSHGHPEGFAGVFGQGGWTALPLAVLVGAIVAVALRIARDVERAPALGVFGATRPSGWPATSFVVSAGAPFHPAPSPLARQQAGRAPPAGR